MLKDICCTMLKWLDARRAGNSSQDVRGVPLARNVIYWILLPGWNATGVYLAAGVETVSFLNTFLEGRQKDHGREQGK
jgi:hypothetical protein